MNKKEIKITHQSNHRIIIVVDGEEFSIGIDNSNELSIKCLNDSLVVSPKANNCIVIRAE